jgi:hypothetical protein
MIKDQTIGSARAEKDHANNRIIQRLMTALLASALTLPSLAAGGTESSPERAMARAGDMLRLPPIRHLDSMPWMNWKASAPTLRIDTLMSPSFTPWGVLKSPQDLISPTLS